MFKQIYTMFKTFIYLCPFLFLLPTNLNAQTMIYQNEAVKIRLKGKTSGTVEGKIRNLKNDTLFVIHKQKPILIPLSQIKQLKVIRGYKTNTRKGALYGGLFGGVGLGLTFAIAVSDEQDEWLTPTPGQAFIGGLLSGGLIGSLVGAIIGSGSTSPRWVEINYQNLHFTKRPESITAKTSKKTMPLPEKKSGKLSLSVFGGLCSSGPAGDIESAMIQSGWNDTSPAGWFSGPTAHPRTNKGGAFSLQLAYKIKPRISVALAFSRSLFGSTTGYRKDIGQYMKLDFVSTMFASLLIFQPNKVLSFGGGPAWFVNKIEQNNGEQIIYREQKGRLGFAFQFTLRFPQRTRFFIILNGQYRLTSAATFGPFKTSYRKTNYEELRSFKANFSHGYLGAGLGLRL